MGTLAKIEGYLLTTGVRCFAPGTRDALQQSQEMMSANFGPFAQRPQ